MGNNIKFQIPENTVKWVVGGACFLGFMYLLGKFLDGTEDQSELPVEAKHFSMLPEVSPNSFDEIISHPMVKESAKKAFEAEDWCGAVRHAVISLYDVIRKKSGVEGDGTELIRRVFRGKNPVLRFRELAPSHIKNVEDGMIDLLEGFSKSVRNVYMHSEVKVSKEVALQLISLACYLAKCIEDNTEFAERIDQ